MAFATVTNLKEDIFLHLKCEVEPGYRIIYDQQLFCVYFRFTIHTSESSVRAVVYFENINAVLLRPFYNYSDPHWK